MTDIDVDLDRTGTSQVILYRRYPFRDRDLHEAYVVADRATMDSLAGKLEGIGAGPANDKSFADSPSLRQFFPYARLGTATGSQAVADGWDAPQLFRWRDGTYLLDQSEGQQRDEPLPLAVYRIRADGSLERKCLIDIAQRGEALAASLASSGLRDLAGRLPRIGGSGGGSCGSLHSEARHVDAASAANRRAVTRPWAVSRHDASFDWYGKYFIYDERMRAFLEDWSRGSTWNRTVYLELQEHIRHAIRGYAITLQQQFGLSTQAAAIRSKEVVEDLVAAWVQVPNGYAPLTDLYSLEQPKITLALLARNPVALDSLLQDTATILAPAPIFPQTTPPLSVVSASMHDAVIWPEGLDALLLAGADVDARNAFGKTPLMSAAHLNRPDAVRSLLAHKAQIDARTAAEYYECGYAIERGGRTALMYAAENAGMETIRLLLAAGADPTLEDSKGNGLAFYLARNPRFARTQSVASVLALAKQKPPADVPSFSCSGSLGEVEAAICGNEVLRLYDREIATAYTSLLPRSGDIKADQRAWLKQRSAQCQAGGTEAVTGCLQDSLYARLRYLHVRLADGAAP